MNFLIFYTLRIEVQFHDSLHQAAVKKKDVLAGTSGDLVELIWKRALQEGVEAFGVSLREALFTDDVSAVGKGV